MEFHTHVHAYVGLSSWTKLGHTAGNPCSISYGFPPRPEIQIGKWKAHKTQAAQRSMSPWRDVRPYRDQFIALLEWLKAPPDPCSACGGFGVALPCCSASSSSPNWPW